MSNFLCQTIDLTAYKNADFDISLTPETKDRSILNLSGMSVECFLYKDITYKNPFTVSSSITNNKISISLSSEQIGTLKSEFPYIVSVSIIFNNKHERVFNGLLRII